MNSTKKKGSEILYLSGMLDIENSAQLRETLLVELSGQGRVVMDLSAVESCDLAGMQVLISARKHAISMGKPFHIKKVSDPIVMTAEAVGVSLEEIVGQKGVPVQRQGENAQ